MTRESIPSHSWTGARSSRQPRQQIEENLINAGIEQSAGHGYPALLAVPRLDHLMEVAGVPKTSFYRVFGGSEEYKEALLAKIATSNLYAIEELQTESDKLLESLEGLPLPDAVAKFGELNTDVPNHRAIRNIQVAVQSAESVGIPNEAASLALAKQQQAQLDIAHTTLTQIHAEKGHLVIPDLAMGYARTLLGLAHEYGSVVPSDEIEKSIRDRAFGSLAFAFSAR